MWLVEWGVWWALWMLFVSKWDFTEACVGLFAALIATAATGVVQKEPLVYFFPYPRWIAQAVTLPWYVIAGTWEALKALGLQIFTNKGSPSILQFIPFDLGPNDAASHARRALALTYTTCTPNFLILGIEYKEGEKTGNLIYHQLLKSPVLKVTKRLGAKP